MKFNFSILKRISIRVPLIIMSILIVGIGITIGYYLRTQNATILLSKENEIKEEASIVYTAIKNNMLAGEAPIAVELFKDFSRSNFAADIKLYKTDGSGAFTDNNTVIFVNDYIQENRFKEKKDFIQLEKNSEQNFNRSVKKVIDVFIRDIDSSDKRLIVYKPLINQPKCSSCHGLDHVVRGVIRISTPVNEVYRMTAFNIILSILIYLAVVIILTGVIIIFLRRVVISRILAIGNVVEGVGSGDFRTKLKMNFEDEIGLLAERINFMIDGLRERFQLSKFVSKSTIDHVHKDEEIKLGGEKKTMTVLFSDIRGFTSYSENNPPELVMERLNAIMQTQADIVLEYGGDVDKYVGDEMFAVFEGEDMVIRAVKAAEDIRAAMKKMNASEEKPLMLGIGINTGDMISGNMGSLDRIDRTVIGDAVNLGARLCSHAGTNTIIISEYSYEYIRDSVIVKEHDPIHVKGKEKAVKIYTLRKTI